MKKITALFFLQFETPSNDIYDTGDVEEIDVTERVLSMPLEKIQSLIDDDYPTDDLCREAARDHSGPYRVKVVNDIMKFFSVDQASTITEEALQAARTEAKIGVPRQYTVSLSRTSTRHADFTVTAGTSDEAVEIALIQAGNYQFPSEKNTVYGVKSISPATLLEEPARTRTNRP